MYIRVQSVACIKSEDGFSRKKPLTFLIMSCTSTDTFPGPPLTAAVPAVLICSPHPQTGPITLWGINSCWQKRQPMLIWPTCLELGSPPFGIWVTRRQGSWPIWFCERSYFCQLRACCVWALPHPPSVLAFEFCNCFLVSSALALAFRNVFFCFQMWITGSPSERSCDHLWCFLQPVWDKPLMASVCLEEDMTHLGQPLSIPTSVLGGQRGLCSPPSASRQNHMHSSHVSLWELCSNSLTLSRMGADTQLPRATGRIQANSRIKVGKGERMGRNNSSFIMHVFWNLFPFKAEYKIWDFTNALRDKYKWTEVKTNYTDWSRPRHLGTSLYKRYF